MSTETIRHCDQCGSVMGKATRQSIVIKREKLDPLAIGQPPVKNELHFGAKSTSGDWGTITEKTQDICDNCFGHVVEVIKAVLTEKESWKEDVWANDDD